MKSLFILISLLFSFTVEAKVDCHRHKIYCRIVTLKPNVNKTFAMKLSNSIHKYSRIYHTDPMITVAIAMQENSFNNTDRIGAVYTKEGKIVKGVTDIGVYQFHVNTFINVKKDLNWVIDIHKFRADIDYQTLWHIRLLKRKIGMCKKLRIKLRVPKGLEWGCYHSYTYRHRTNYIKDVGRYLPTQTKRIIP